MDKNVECSFCGNKFITPEEKRTDVGIAVNMLLDCTSNVVDLLILVTADSDQIPTIKAIKSQFPDKEIRVYFPPKRQSTEILSLAKPVVFLEENEFKFAQAQMPDVVENPSKGNKYTRPQNWKT